MALLPSVATRVTVELTRYRSAVSEFLAQTLGKSINYLLDRTDTIENDIDSLITELNSKYTFIGASTTPNNVTVPSGEIWVVFVKFNDSGTIAGYLNFTNNLLVKTLTSGESTPLLTNINQFCFAIKFSVISL
jgi:hypothetical protein